MTTINFSEYLKEAKQAKEKEILEADAQKDAENKALQTKDGSHGDKADVLDEKKKTVKEGEEDDTPDDDNKEGSGDDEPDEDDLEESLNEAKSIQDTFKDINLKVLLILKDDEKTIVSQDFVESEIEARKIAKTKMKEGQYAKYFDLGADKSQSWYKPKKD